MTELSSPRVCFRGHDLEPPEGNAADSSASPLGFGLEVEVTVEGEGEGERGDGERGRVNMRSAPEMRMRESVRV